VVIGKIQPNLLLVPQAIQKFFEAEAADAAEAGEGAPATVSA